MILGISEEHRVLYKDDPTTLLLWCNAPNCTLYSSKLLWYVAKDNVHDRNDFMKANTKSEYQLLELMFFTKHRGEGKAKG